MGNLFSRELKKGKSVLKFVYLGKNGRTKLFEAYLDGVALERAFVPGKEADEKTLENFFNADAFNF